MKTSNFIWKTIFSQYTIKSNFSFLNYTKINVCFNLYCNIFNIWLIWYILYLIILTWINTADLDSASGKGIKIIFILTTCFYLFNYKCTLITCFNLLSAQGMFKHYLLTCRNFSSNEIRINREENLNQECSHFQTCKRHTLKILLFVVLSVEYVSPLAQ